MAATEPPKNDQTARECWRKRFFLCCCHLQPLKQAGNPSNQISSRFIHLQRTFDPLRVPTFTKARANTPYCHNRFLGLYSFSVSALTASRSTPFKSVSENRRRLLENKSFSLFFFFLSLLHPTALSHVFLLCITRSCQALRPASAHSPLTRYATLSGSTHCQEVGVMRYVGGKSLRG